MSIFSDNLRYLRESRKESQQLTAESLEIKRGRYEPYESGKTEPPYEVLKRISRHYSISIDLLLSVDLRRHKIDTLIRLEDNRLLLPIAVDYNGGNLIEIVPHKARAGYLTGYADPEFVESLQQISLPFLGPGKHRAFPVGGDSMPPHNDLSFVVGKYVENLGEIKKDKTYILITLSEGITYKRLSSKNADSLTVEPDNIIYTPYDIKLSDILEIWEYVAHIGRDDHKAESHNAVSLEGVIRKLQADMADVKAKVT
jgi:transcriptional regulator with XRE-family HTH domain